MKRRVRRRSGPKLLLADPDTRRRYLDAISNGAPLSHAAVFAGINISTVWRALRRAEEADAKLATGETLTSDDKLCQGFAAEVKTARAAVAVRNVALVQQAAEGGYLLRHRTLRNGTVEREYAQVDWRAAKWLLEMSFKGEFTASSPPVELDSLGGGGRRRWRRLRRCVGEGGAAAACGTGR